MSGGGTVAAEASVSLRSAASWSWWNVDAQHSKLPLVLRRC